MITVMILLLSLLDLPLVSNDSRWGMSDKAYVGRCFDAKNLPEVTSISPLEPVTLRCDWGMAKVPKVR